MEDLSLQDTRSISKYEKDDKIAYNNVRTNSGICCICRKPPAHSKNYYGHVFCSQCFYKYIFSPAKNDCSGDITKKDKEDKKEGIEVKKEVVEDEKEVKEDFAAAGAVTMEVAK